MNSCFSAPFQALEFFLKAEEGKTQHTHKVTETFTEILLLLAAAQILRSRPHCACTGFL